MYKVEESTLTGGLRKERADTAGKKIDDFINVTRLGNRVIVVRMGTEAVTALATQKGIIVIDAGISNSLTAKYRKLIEIEFKRNDFSYLINTHSHRDHTGGNQVFSDALIVGHENCPGEITENMKNPEKIKSNVLKIIEDYDKDLKILDPGSEDWEESFCQKNRFQYYYNDLLNDRKVTIPTVTFNDRISLFMGDVTLNLIYFGKAHCVSDIIVHSPEEKVLMVGDLFSAGGRPHIENVSDLDAERWLNIKQWLSIRWNEIDKVIGGHGQIMAKEDLDSFIKQIDTKREKAK